MYEERTYRRLMAADGLTYFSVVVYETDLYIAARRDFSKAVSRTVKTVRFLLTAYEGQHPGFFSALSPLPVLPEDPILIKRMKKAAELVGVGPMAGVAGAVNLAVGETLDPLSPEYLIENGGDLLLKTLVPRRIAMDAGQGNFDGLGLRIPGRGRPLGICSSAGTRGHSLSFGKADMATVISDDAILSDCAATAFGNRLKSAADLPDALAWIQTVPGVKGVVGMIDGQIGAWGEIELC